MEGVAWAVAAAHARGVLHRDVKPGNVLLTPSGRALIGDFGLATAVVTAKAGRVVGTPGFMAPEQVRGEAATPRSDVWGLGATLGYALMGRWPAGLEGLPGDVRAVVERATAGEAGARYTSAEGLAVDLRAVLEGRGTVARPPGAVRGAVMWARRHAAPVVVGVLGVVVALGLTARFVWRLEGERDRAVKAEREAMVAARVAATAAAAAEGAALEAARQRDVALMLNRFTGEVTGAALRMYEDRAVTLQEALALAERRVGYSLAGRPLLEAAAKQFLGGAALAAGDAAKARGLLVRAVEIREGALGRDAAETLRSRRLLALTEGERAEAETAGLLPTLEERLGVADPDVCAAKLYLGVAAAKRGDLERAEGLLRAAVGGLKAGGNEGTLDWQEAAGNLGQVMLSRGDVEGGLGQFRSVVEEVERLLGEGDVRALNARHNLARAYVRVERLSEAEAELRGLRERSVRLLGDTHSGAIFAATALGEFLLQKRREAGGAEEALVLARGAIPEKVRGMVTVGARYRAELLEGSALAALGRLGEAEGVLAGIVKDAERRKVTGNVSVRAAAESLEKVRAARGRGE
jgi:tetratricopeptide (TPR) repeat protein